MPEADESGREKDEADKVIFPTVVEEEETKREGESDEGRDGEMVDGAGPRSAGHRFYSDVSEKHREEDGTLSGVAISPLQWLGGLRSLKVQGELLLGEIGAMHERQADGPLGRSTGGFPVPQPDESLGLVKPDYSFAFKPWIGECGVETLVWSFQGAFGRLFVKLVQIS